MVEPLAWAALGLVAFAVALMGILVARRLALARAESARLELEPALRPVAAALVSGEEVDLARLDLVEAEVLAGLVRRFARDLAGETNGPVAAFFERSGHVEAEIRATADRRAWRRAAAAYALGDMGSRRAVPALLARLRDPSRDVRDAAARSLGSLRSEVAAEGLVRGLADGRLSGALAVQSVLAIGSTAGDTLRRLAADGDPAVRAAAAELLGLLGDASDAPFLQALLDDPSPLARARAARRLGRLGAREACAQLRARLGDDDPAVRGAAAATLASLGDRGAYELLVRLARDDEFDVAQAAARAAARIDPARTSVLAEARDASPHLQEAADLLQLEAL